MTDIRTGTRYIDIVGTTFVAILLISNTIAVKVIDLGSFSIAAGIVCFPIAYIFGDVLTEVYGYARTRRIIWTGFSCLAMMSFFYWAAVQLPPAGFWDTPLTPTPDGFNVRLVPANEAMQAGQPFEVPTKQDAVAAVLGFAPRIAAASILAYLIGSFVNAFVMSWMKVKTKGRHLWMRTIGSTICGEGADSIVFAVAAFGLVLPWHAIGTIAISGFLLKSLYEIVATPMTYFIVGRLKRLEGVDQFDEGVSYNPFTLK